MSKYLRVDPIACTGHGLCAELFPEWIELDDWGYPIIDRGPIPQDLVIHARRAAEACPKLALALTPRAAEAEARSGSKLQPPL
jgi:ferredoxin